MLSSKFTSVRSKHFQKRVRCLKLLREEIIHPKLKKIKRPNISKDDITWFSEITYYITDHCQIIILTFLKKIFIEMFANVFIIFVIKEISNTNQELPLYRYIYEVDIRPIIRNWQTPSSNA